MAKPLRLPGIEEQCVLDELEIQLLVEPAQQARWNRLVKERHYLRNATCGGTMSLCGELSGPMGGLAGVERGGLAPESSG
jgi:hypothetical protein